MSRLSIRHLHMGCGESLRARRAAKPRKERPLEEAHNGDDHFMRPTKTPPKKGKEA